MSDGLVDMSKLSKIDLEGGSFTYPPGVSFELDSSSALKVVKNLKKRFGDQKVQDVVQKYRENYNKMDEGEKTNVWDAYFSLAYTLSLVSEDACKEIISKNKEKSGEKKDKAPIKMQEQMVSKVKFLEKLKRGTDYSYCNPANFIRALEEPSIVIAYDLVRDRLLADAHALKYRKGIFSILNQNQALQLLRYSVNVTTDALKYIQTISEAQGKVITYVNDPFTNGKFIWDVTVKSIKVDDVIAKLHESKLEDEYLIHAAWMVPPSYYLLNKDSRLTKEIKREDITEILIAYYSFEDEFKELVNGYKTPKITIDSTKTLNQRFKGIISFSQWIIGRWRTVMSGGSTGTVKLNERSRNFPAGNWAALPTVYKATVGEIKGATRVNPGDYLENSAKALKNMTSSTSSSSSS